MNRIGWLIAHAVSMALMVYVVGGWVHDMGGFVLAGAGAAFGMNLQMFLMYMVEGRGWCKN